MSALMSAVTDGLSGQGLEVLSDRGGLAVRDLDPEMPISIWVDETERVIRAEAPLCYPIDDYSPDLAQAIDWLNSSRAGLTFSYREANRAVVVSSSWTSPNRAPSHNQLHLLMALLVEAKHRDAPQLMRVAEGESGWDEVVDHEEGPSGRQTQTLRFRDSLDNRTGGTGKFQRGSGTGQFQRGSGTGKFRRPSGSTERPATGSETTRWSELMGIAEGNEDKRGSSRWRDTDGMSGFSRPSGATRRPTGATQRPSGATRRPTGANRRPEALDDMPTRRLDQLEDEREGHGDPSNPDEIPQRLSRHSLHLAVSSLDKEEHAKVDMTVHRRSGMASFFKFVFVVGVVGGLGYALASYYKNITGQSILPDFASWGTMVEETMMSEDELRLKARQELAGLELLVAEIKDPLPGEAHALMLNKALAALGDEAAEALEGLAARGTTTEERKRAFDLWAEREFDRREGARLRLLQLLGENKRSDDDPVVTSLLGRVRSSPPADAVVIEALDWAKGGTWLTLIEILGRGGDGAEARSKEITARLVDDPSETKEALKALVRTGFPPPRAALDLVLANGPSWLASKEGETLITSMIDKDVALLEPLFGVDNEEIRLAAVDFLTESGYPETIDLLVRVMRTDASVAVRKRVVKGLGAMNTPQVIWPLALQVNSAAKTPEDEQVNEEALKVLRKQSENQVVNEIEVHLTSDRPIKERVWAINALGLLETPAAVQALLEKGLRDPDERLRHKVVQTLSAQRDAAATTLQRGLHILRDVSRNDESEAVRQAADKLYQSMIRR